MPCAATRYDRPLMARVCLVACVSEKVDGPVPAADLYVSDWFKKARAYAESHADRWFILSAEHGVLTPVDTCSRYEKTLIGQNQAGRRAWAERVVPDLLARLKQGDEVTVLAGEDYREFVVPALEAKGFAVRIPMQGRGIGEQKRWLINPHAQHVERFYDLLEDLSRKLGGPRQLGKCRGVDRWPKRGVYFFFEPGEMRRFKPAKPRVVRIGTHAIRAGEDSKLWTRLRWHRGSHKTGGGNHRGSIFRLHAGAAMLRREGLTAPATWSVKNNVTRAVKEPEKDLERRVSAYLGNMTLLWLDVDDAPGPDSDRATIERNAIALLSQSDDVIDPSSPDWLGLHSANDKIRTSGLWNVNHIGDAYDPAFLAVMEQRIDQGSEE